MRSPTRHSSPTGAAVTACSLLLTLCVGGPARGSPPDVTTTAQQSEESDESEGVATDDVMTRDAATEDAKPAPAPNNPPTLEGDPPADASLAEQGTYWFEQGHALREAEEYRLAGLAFRRAAARFGEAKQNAREAAALYNEGKAWEKADRAIDALQAFAAFIDRADPSLPQMGRAKIAVAALRDRVGTIRDVRLPRGRDASAIIIDGQEIGEDDFPVFVLPGPIAVSAVDRRGRRLEGEVELAAGEARVIELIEPEVPGAQGEFITELPTIRDERYEARKRATRRVFYTSAALTGAAGVMWAVFAGLTLREQRLVDENTCPEQMCPPGWTGNPQDHIRRFQIFKPASNAMAGVTSGLALTTAILAIVSFTKPKQQDPTAARVTVHPGGLRLRF